MSDYPGRPRPEPTAPVDGVGVFCANCHAPMPPDADFCNRCGAPRLTRDTSPTQVLPVAPPRARETVVEEDIRHDVPYVQAPPPTNWWPLAALGVLGVLILLLVLFLAFEDDDDDVVDPATTTTLLPPTTVVPPPLPAPAPTQPPQTVFVPVQPAPTTAPTTAAPTTTAPPTTAPPTTAPPTTAPVSGL